MKQNNQQVKINFKEYLSEIYNKPQKLHKAYSCFHNYSFNNTILATNQLGKEEPINTFQGWKKLGRNVKKGSKAICLFLPVVYKTENDEGEEVRFTDFLLRNHWFGYSQTEGEGEEVDFIIAPSFDLEKALKALEINQETFQSIRGNVQGYAKTNQNIIAINPMAFAPYKTMIHEIAHCLLHKSDGIIFDDKELTSSIKEFEAETTAYLVCCSLGKFDHLEYSRFYIANWITKEEVKEENFKRAFDAANKILRVGLV